MVRKAALKARKSYAENDDSGDDLPKGDDHVSDFTDSSSEEEAAPVRTPKPPPKKRLKSAPPKKIQYKEPESDDSGPDDAELEGEDSDFEVSKPKQRTPAQKPKPKTPTKKKNSTPKKKPEKNGKKAKVSPASVSKSGRASGRATKPVRYSVDSESEEEGDSESDVEVIMTTKKNVKRPAIMKKSVRREPTHPPVSEMIPIAIRKLKENPRKGSSIAAIKGFMAEEWGANIKSLSSKIKNYLVNACSDGELIRRSGSGASGRFTVPGMKYKPKKRRKKIIKSDEEDNAEEAEYKPAKRARDEDRERELVDKEERRLQRQEMEYQKQLEKEARPKKSPVKRKEEYEVEYIKSKREVGDVIYYLVKYKDYKKLWWEPEENLTGCAEIVENFYLEEKVRLAEEEERKKMQDEGGEYEVGRILEVRFPKGKAREFLIRWKGCGEDDDTWEPEENLNCEEMIEKFMAKHERMLEVSEKRLREAPKKIERLNYSKNPRFRGRHNGFRMTYEGMDD
eukprot:TRINITY_DN9604_c0_g1_i13.p1 TRINITY_DN9604_c0_g1~~TRINITY_DN9604_c0_g1_i13.p1  ORF type:complete len:509 (-),score=155.29 TRINITY_DN9604_c0_g1_i13:244-1770(-)